ncbi:MAG TPA: tetratricopeptide repeat protein [Afifellaceae bacterium]|nr:tetratricopeptide repeat protein [Afifellaceae bacterium]
MPQRLRRPPAPPLRKALVAGCVLTLLAACQATGSSRAPMQTASIRTAPTLNASDMSQDQAVRAVQSWGAAYGRNEKDKAAALNYAAALRGAGQTSQAAAVLRKAAIYHPKDREVLAAYGKALAADGQFEEALLTIQRAQHRDNPDWQLLAAEGGILDSLGKHEDARRIYRQALVMAPGEPQVLNNLGLSYVLTGELPEAEKTLRQAAANPRASIRVRQNLALVLGLKGDFQEAEAVATSDLPPDQAKANMAYLRTMLNQQNTWKDLKPSG